LKIVKGEDGLEFEKARFDIFIQTLVGDELKEWWEENRKDKEGNIRPFPKRNFTNAIIGHVGIANVSCEDHGPYIVRYDNGEQRESRKRPIPFQRGFFFLVVEGCPGPHPQPRRGPAIFVKNFQVASKDKSYDFKFGVAGKKALNETEVHLWKVVKGKRGPDFKPTGFDISLRTLSEDEIKDWENERKNSTGRHFPHVIVGKVGISSVSCDDQGLYLIKYGSHHHDDEEDEECPHPCPHPHPRPRGLFFIRVRGCRKPRPDLEWVDTTR